MKTTLPVLCLLLAAAAPLPEDALVRQVRNAVIHHHLAPSPQCLEYRVTRNASPGVDMVGRCQAQPALPR